MRLRKWNKRGSTDDDETSLSNSRSVDAALPRPDAVWILHVGEVCSDGGIRSFIIPILYQT